MLKSYCTQNGITESEVLKIIDLYDQLGDKVDAANEEYIKYIIVDEYQDISKQRFDLTKYPQLDITFMTVHMAKGLGYDNVIVVNGKNETYGFPSKIEDDPVLSFVIKGDNSIDYAEERRLFYVAMTRTKNRVYFIAPEQNPSEFLLEIKRDYKSVILKGKWNEGEIKQNSARKICPICGYPLQFRYKNAYGLKLYMCTNDQEMCGFMTNDIKAGKLAIMKCDKCRDGYLIAKNAGNGYFLGCTNYKKDKTGCNNTIGTNEYLTLRNIEPDFAESFVSAVRVVPVEEKKKTTDNQIRKPEVVNVPDVKPEQYVTRNIIFTDDNAKNMKANDLSDMTFKGQDLMELARSTVKCLGHMSENYYFGITVLISVLRGGKRKQIIKHRLNEVPEYGIYADMSRDDMRAVVQWLINNRYMLKTKASRK